MKNPIHWGTLLVLTAGSASAQQPMQALLERGESLFNSRVGCWVCHAENGEGLVGPSLHFGPTPADILEQLQSNPVMGVIAQEMDPTDEDLVAIALYIRQLADLPLTDGLAGEYREMLATIRARSAPAIEFPLTERDRAVAAIESFGSVLTDWERKADTGNIRRVYESEVIATFDPGEPKFEPEPNHTYFYENTGINPNLTLFGDGFTAPASTQIVVGDAEAKKVIASYELPGPLRATVHGTLMSPDGRYVYIIGSNPSNLVEASDRFLGTPATLIKADAVTLQPVKQVTIGGRLHHGQVFQDRYLLLDTFSRDPDGLDVMLFDPETDQVIGGVRDEELGGRTYTSWTDDEFIYILMEPAGYGFGNSPGFFAANNLATGRLTALRPFWVAKVDPESWQVVREYPYPGYRASWISFDAAKEHLYLTNSGSSNMVKLNIETGAIVWTGSTGISPYGNSLNADESEIWSADKGEAAGQVGRTLTVLDATSGQSLATLFGGYKVDHVLLAPNGREMWATSNGEGRVYVYDARTREQTHVIDMPQRGDAHGLVWVHYDDSGTPRVVRDQGGFHGGINPAAGNALNY